MDLCSALGCQQGAVWEVMLGNHRDSQWCSSHHNIGTKRADMKKGIIRTVENDDTGEGPTQGSPLPIPRESPPLPDNVSLAYDHNEGPSPFGSSRSLFSGAGVEAWSQEERDILERPVSFEHINTKPDGAIYFPQIGYRKRLNEAFGVGAWALVPLDKSDLEDGYMMREYALIVKGRFVASAVGQMRYVSGNRNMSLADANEGAKSDALTRCCKDVGIALDCWDFAYQQEFKAECCVQVRRRDGKYYWRRKDAEPWSDEVNSRHAGESEYRQGPSFDREANAHMDDIDQTKGGDL